MMRILILLSLFLLSIGCVQRDNIFDPKADNYEDPIKRRIYKLSAIALVDTAWVLHLELKNAEIDSAFIEFGNGNENLLHSDSVLDIVVLSAGDKITGSMDVATIKFVEPPLGGNPDYSITLLNGKDEEINYNVASLELVKDE